MAVKRRRKNSIVTLLGWVLFLALVGSLLYELVSTRLLISSQERDLAALQIQLAECGQNVEELRRTLRGSAEEIVEQVARDEYGYAAPNERIFVDISGN